MTVRREDIPFQLLDLTPSTLAEADQLHAVAMQLLRRAEWYALTVAYVDEEGRSVKKSIAGGSGDREDFRSTLFVAALEATRMVQQLPAGEEES